MADILDKSEVTSPGTDVAIYVVTDPGGSPADSYATLINLLGAAQMPTAEAESGTATTVRTITAADLKAAIEALAPVESVNTETGAVSLNASDVGAAPTSHQHAWDGGDITSQPTEMPQAEAEAGTSTTERTISANVLAAAIAAQGGGGNPAGSDGQIQFNDNGSFGGFGTWDGTLAQLPGHLRLYTDTYDRLDLLTTFATGDAAVMGRRNLDIGSFQDKVYISRRNASDIDARFVAFDIDTFRMGVNNLSPTASLDVQAQTGQTDPLLSLRDDVGDRKLSVELEGNDDVRFNFNRNTPFSWYWDNGNWSYVIRAKFGIDTSGRGDVRFEHMSPDTSTILNVTPNGSGTRAGFAFGYNAPGYVYYGNHMDETGLHVGTDQTGSNGSWPIHFYSKPSWGAGKEEPSDALPIARMHHGGHHFGAFPPSGSLDAALQVVGGIKTDSIPDPAAPTLSVVGTTGTTDYTYYVVAETVGGRLTAPSPAATITGPDTLDGDNYIVIEMPDNAGAEGIFQWHVLKGDTATRLTYVRNVPATISNDTYTTLTTHDTGGSTEAFTAPNRNQTGDVEIGGGLLELSEPGEGVILASPDGTRYKVTVDNAGNLTTTAI